MSYKLNPLVESKREKFLKEDVEPVGLLAVAYVVIGRIAAAIGDRRKVKALTKIVEAYPNPNTLYKKLKQNPKTYKLAISLYEFVDLANWEGSEDDYYDYSVWILKNVLHYFGILRYLATVLGGPISLAYQIMKTAATKNYTADRIIFGKDKVEDISNEGKLNKPQKNKKISSSEDLLVCGISYITTHFEKDPILIKEMQEFKKLGLAVYGNYDNLIMCCQTCMQHMQRGATTKMVATQTKSGKRIVSWTRSQLKTNKMMIEFSASR